MFWAFVSYAMWGIFPIYWKLLGHVPAMEILGHRMLWSFAFYLLLFVLGSGAKLRNIFRQSRRDWMLSAFASLLLTVNWGVYIYSINAGHIIEGSLAYFINPILNVAVGVVLFKEKFPLVLKLAVLFAAIGVATKIYYAPTFPWISLVLAATFCTYGATKKLLKIPARTSSLLEGTASLLPALVLITYFRQQATAQLTPSTLLLLVGGGIVTGLPLFMFSHAAQRVPYSTMGMLQFIAPTLQFLVAVWMFHEPFGPKDSITFGFIWLGISFYLAYQLHQRSRRPAVKPVAG